ncbi:MAG: DAK2 domain-containing protein [Anaerolineaceae bacterium]|nr:DAK2 domain-containing protein [Anaerolineaceae bacterium]
MATNPIDLFSLFNQVTSVMKKSKASLNDADSYNHDHGDHMVEIFEVITQAMKQKKNAEPADQLEYAADLLRGKAKSGSGKLYAQGLNKAARQMSGKTLNAGSIMAMLQTILGAGKASASGGDMLTSLLGSLTGGQKGGADLGDLVGALTGAGSADSQSGLDLGDLLGAGMNLLSASKDGKSNLEALTGALVSGSQMASSSPYREQSSQLVTQTMLKALTSMLSK